MERTILCSIIMRLATYKATRITDVIIIAVLCLYIDVGCLSCQQVSLAFPPERLISTLHVRACDFFVFFAIFLSKTHTVQFSNLDIFFSLNDVFLPLFVRKVSFFVNV